MDFTICPFCNEDVPSMELERHANNHFENEEQAIDLEVAQAISLVEYDETGNGSGEFDIHEKKIRSLSDLQIRANFHKVEPGLMTLLKKCLDLESEKSTSIISGYVDHFESIEFEDVGWGCGWRNIQMLSSNLFSEREESKKVLFGGCGFVPDISSLQRWLEIAWGRGFDVIGSSHFDMAIHGERKWIGTTECAALFRSFGVRARIVDFDSKPCLENQGVQKRKHDQVYGPMDQFLSGGSRADVSSSSAKRGHEVLMEWIWNYFRKPGNDRVIVSDKTPLYFQHDGHSRTIVGIQVKHQKNGSRQYNLLILDPAHSTVALERSLRENVGWQKLIKRGGHTLRKPQYQLCYIDSGIADKDETEKLKILESIYVEF
ncbi:zinc finger-containing ubiquitin peptidase 1 [Impatiens glandulifera]|uniref:zinc finger-containing ubiquitin peptidase 1 n=1 Tax=Impatiens glandulifera TaxID=253017 RepID=UPI001FB0DE30|nr:zinc finger-containing ubiquitin peptidase 1 [Impatiens glandulifera]